MVVKVTRIRSNKGEDRKNLKNLTWNLKSWVFCVGEDDQLNMNLINKKPSVFIWYSTYDRERPSLLPFHYLFFFLFDPDWSRSNEYEKKMDSEERRAFIFILAHSGTSRFTDTIERIESLFNHSLVHGWLILIGERNYFSFSIRTMGMWLRDRFDRFQSHV